MRITDIINFEYDEPNFNCKLSLKSEVNVGSELIELHRDKGGIYTTVSGSRQERGMGYLDKKGEQKVYVNSEPLIGQNPNKLKIGIGKEDIFEDIPEGANSYLVLKAAEEGRWLLIQYRKVESIIFPVK